MGSRGRRLLALLPALLAGCVGNGATAPAATPEPAPVAAVRDAQPAPEPEPEPTTITLRRQHRTGDRYEVVTTFTLSDTPVHPDIGYTTWAHATVTPDPSGAVVARGRFYKSLLTHGDEVNPLGRDSDLTGVEVGLWLDETNRVTGQELTGHAAHNGDMARVVLDSLRAVRVYYPEGPVPVGATWEGDPLRWDTRPAGWVVVNVRPVYTLEGLERADDGAMRARVRWSGTAEVEPFEVAGISLSARIPLDGVSTIDLDDGYTATHDIRGRVELFLAANAGHVSDMASMRILQEVTRR